MKKSLKNGFTMIETLLALLTSLIVSFLCILFLQTCLKIIQFEPLHQEQMAILQLRQILSLSSHIHVEKDCLEMTYRHKTIRIEQDQNRLVKRDGYEILMEDIDAVYFKEEENAIYFSWKKHNKTYSMQLY